VCVFKNIIYYNILYILMKERKEREKKKNIRDREELLFSKI